jgi:hypothetical protein
MPKSLRRLALAHCTSVPASSLASIGRLSVLEELTLHSLPDAGGNDALQQLALHLPASLTSLELTGFTEYWRKVSAVICDCSQQFYDERALICLQLQQMLCPFSGQSPFGLACGNTVASVLSCRRTPGA